MKDIIRRVEVALRGAAATTKTWFDPPLAADAEPIEIREAIIEDIARHVEPVDGMRRVLPFNHVSVVLLAATRIERARLEGALGGLHDSVRKRLAEIECPLPPGLAIEVRYIKQPRVEWTADQRLAIDYDARAHAAGARASTAEIPALDVTVLRGEASEPRYTFTRSPINIGRTPKPVDARGRPRLNHVVFIEGADEHSRTVGRAHASIRYDAARNEFRLFDDGSHNGTRIVRGGATIEVDARDPAGVTVRPGDEIELGTASLRVDLAT